MRQFVSTTALDPGLRAWLNPEDPKDESENPLVPRNAGWRIVVERVDASEDVQILRSTWEQTISEALRHMDGIWPEEPVWRDDPTGMTVTVT